MPSILRSRIALLALLGVFLIPIGMSSLRGLSHVLTCQEEAETPFQLLIPRKGDPILTSATGRITRDEPTALCAAKKGEEGLSLEMGAKELGKRRIAMVTTITNQSGSPWRGTVKLLLGKTSIPVDIGEIPAGKSASDEVPFDLEIGEHEVNGSLLIGP
jgi:hypothetical protein